MEHDAPRGIVVVDYATAGFDNIIGSFYRSTRELRMVFLSSNRIGRPIRFRMEFSNRIGRIYHASRNTVSRTAGCTVQAYRVGLYVDD